MVALNRPTKSTAKVRETMTRLNQSATVCEPVVRIQRLVTEEIEPGPVKLVCAGFSDNRNVRAGIPSVLSALTKTMDGDLLR